MGALLTLFTLNTDCDVLERNLTILRISYDEHLLQYEQDHLAMLDRIALIDKFTIVSIVLSITICISFILYIICCVCYKSNIDTDY